MGRSHAMAGLVSIVVRFHKSITCVLADENTCLDDAAMFIRMGAHGVSVVHPEYFNGPTTQRAWVFTRPKPIANAARPRYTR